MWARLPGDGATGHEVFVLQPTATIARGIASDHFVVVPGRWHTQSVAVLRHRREVTDKHKGLFFFCTPSQKGHDSLVRVMHVNPGNPCWVRIQRTQCGFPLVEQIQVAYKGAQLGMMGIAWREEQMPVQALGEGPFLPLPKFASHKQELFPWVAP